MASLTKEQLEKIEANRQLAIQRRNERLKVNNNSPNMSSIQCSSTATLQKPVINKFYTSNISASSMLPVAKHNKFNASKKVSNKPKQIVTGNCKLISKERFSVNVSYHAQLIDVFKSIPSRAYDPNEKTWNFSLSDYSTVMKKIRDLREEVSISELPTLLLRLFSQKSQTPQNPEAIDLSRIDQILLDALMPFQRDGICFGISKNGRCLLADDMGLGKTIQDFGHCSLLCTKTGLC
ncbi:hypothetical protein L9F63_001251 [Diploptera punctata]|uniref:HARP domain-containing protein n=1 Tax=Diploptera punctata TaxID=6984 RepID=A0AAD8A420_DIPPU|nr:hypothetical protein L9F63_001251 [Diploptera punctata]